MNWVCKIELKNSDISKLQDTLGVIFSNKFKDFLYTANGASLQYKDFTIKDKKYVINAILDFRIDAKYSIMQIYNNISEDVGNFIPFANNGFGDYYVLDLSNDNVYFYEHESGDIELLVDIETFIKLLEEKNG